jgi:peptide/nickel transport system ATP-binding protein
MSEEILRLRHLSKSFYRGGNETVRAVEKVNFSVNRGEFFGVVGESGCGKSTLGRLILRLIEADEGQVFFEDEEISAASKKRLAELRPLMQMIFQNPFASFDPKRTLRFSLEEAACFHGFSRTDAKEKILKLLELINLSADVLPRLPKELSGGQLQRLAIARALVTDPRFIVADEPVSALDVSVQAQLLNLLHDLKKQLHLTMLFISHDIQVIQYLCDRVAVMYMGGIVEIAGAALLFARPLHPYTRALIAAAPRTEPGQNQNVLRGLYPMSFTDPGDVSNPWENQRGCRFAPRCSKCVEQCLAETPPLAEGGDGHFAACHFID